jgi:hypothetical protein
MPVKSNLSLTIPSLVVVTSPLEKPTNGSISSPALAGLMMRKARTRIKS